jgi:Sensors of blue-light using FAD
VAGPLYRLVYASRISPGCLADLKLVMPSLLAAAMARNRDLGVTSLLCAHRGWFLQALEGPEAAVIRLFDVIAADYRHHGAAPVVEGRASDRLFGCWSLAARSLSPADPAVAATLGPAVNFDPTELPATTLVRLLTTVGEVHTRTLSQQQALEGALR